MTSGSEWGFASTFEITAILGVWMRVPASASLQAQHRCLRGCCIKQPDHCILHKFCITHCSFSLAGRM